MVQMDWIIFMTNSKDSKFEFPVQNEKVKKLFYRLWSIFPNGLTREEVEEVIVLDVTRKRLEKHGILFIEEQNKGGENVSFYGLGPAGIALISTWETEKLAKYALIVAMASLIISVVALLMNLRGC